MAKEQYTVTGMTCAACSARVEKAVSAVPGVTECSVNLLTNSMGVEGAVDPQTVIAAVEHAGYGAALKSGRPTVAAEPVKTSSETMRLLKRFLVSLVFLLALMYFSMGHTMWNWPLPRGLAGNPVAVGLLQLLLTIIVMVINREFFISGAKSLWRRSPNMDALVALGSAAAFGYSTVILFVMTAAQSSGADAAMHYLHDLYFESAAMILALITLGKMLDARAKGKTTDALKSLMQLAPKTAVLLRDGAEIEVPVEQVKRGDIFVVRPGENIPVDGIILDGESAVDESALTGESIPVDKAVGSNVSAGTLNRSGFLRCEAVKVGEDTTLSQIIRMVEDAAATKAPIAKIADKVSGIFVPTVILIALVTVIGWLIARYPVGYALARGISVLVISCPCALGLATPVAIMVGNGVGARNGILFKTAASLESAGRAEIVVLDKTGTITQGMPRVTDLLPVGVDAQELLTAAYALERKSEHPLARAILERAEQDGITAAEAEEFRILPGNGLTAIVGGQTLYGGNRAFIEGVAPIPQDLLAQADALAEQGKTPLYFARGNTLLGVIAVADVMKDDSLQAVRELKDMGLTVVMLTGDNERTAQAIGAQAGVDTVIAGVLPDGKESTVRALQADGRVVMVGDGINDAPALTSADTGIAIGAGTDVAIDAADVVLVKSRLTDVPAAIRLSRATLWNIRENLFWAFIYNIIGIPLAAGVFIHWLGWELNPMFAAAAMSLSSFCVVMNALRLNFKNIRKAKKSKSSTQKSIEIKEVTTMKKTLQIEGMMCGHCEAHVKKALEALDGVDGATVSHAAGTAVVTLSADVGDDALKAAVEVQGYTVKGIA